jgi:hypothetical protein
MAKVTMEEDDAALSLRIPTGLMELIEYVADQREEPVDEAVRSMLEEIVEIERIRRMSRVQSRLEQKALFGSRKAKRAVADAWETIMAAWRARRPKRVEPGPVVISIEVSVSRMDEIEYLADRRHLPVRTFAFGLINEIVDIVHERSMSDEEAALRRQAADPDLSRKQRLAAWRGAIAVWQEELVAWRAERTKRQDRPTPSRRKRGSP